MEVTSSVKSPQGDEGSVVQLPQRADRFNRSVQVKKKKKKTRKDSIHTSTHYQKK